MDIAFEGQMTERGHELVQRVYYEDTDFSGAVYHARYLHFMERARTELIRLKGYTQSKALSSDDPDEATGFMVARLDVQYKRPARMDDILTIVSQSVQTRGARMVLSQKIYRQDELLIDATVTIVCVNGLGRPKRIPADLLS